MKVSIITVNYNQPQVTIELLESLSKQDFTDMEVIVVDNGSKENCEGEVLSRFPEVKFIRSEENLGFAGGNNLGIRAAKGEYLFFVNNDTEIPDNTIQRLSNYMEETPQCGIVCPLICFHDNKEMLQYAGYTDINVFTGRNATIGEGSAWTLENRHVSTSFPHGAAMMIPKRIINEVGEMPENYFLYYEELDWAYQIKQAGYHVTVDHGSYILHKESISTGKASVLKTYFLTRNRILFMRRNVNWAGKLAFTTFFGLLSTPKNILHYITNADWGHARAFLAGITWNLTHSTKSLELGYKFNNLKES